MKLTTVLAAFVGLAISAPAFAQAKPMGLAVEVGGNYVTDSDVRDAVGDVGLRVALNYQLPTPSLLGKTTGGRPSVNLSYTLADDEVKLTTWGLTYEERVPFSSAVYGGAPGLYWGLGVGMFRSKAEFEVTETETAAETIDETDTNFGGRLLLGMDFNKYYAELSYNLSGDVADGDTNSIALAAGFRF